MSFQNLIRTIGSAPSELSRADLMMRLSTERDRIRRTLAHFQSQFQAKTKTIKTKTKPKTGGKPATKAMTKIKNSGLTIEQLQAALGQITRENSQ